MSPSPARRLARGGGQTRTESALDALAAGEPVAPVGLDAVGARSAVHRVARTVACVDPVLALAPVDVVFERASDQAISSPPALERDVAGEWPAERGSAR